MNTVAFDYPRGPWLVQARYSDGVAAFWNRFATRDDAESWAQFQRDSWTPGQHRYAFEVLDSARSEGGRS